MTMTLSRRDMLLAAVGAAIAAAGTAGFPATLYAEGEAAGVTLDQFMTLSEKLTEQKSLDQTIGKTLLGGFLAAGQGARLATLVQQTQTANSFTDLANTIVAAWYSGVYTGADGQAVATFTDALVWKALAFTKPWAECGGATGYWSQPPSA